MRSEEEGAGGIKSIPRLHQAKSWNDNRATRREINV